MEFRIWTPMRSSSLYSFPSQLLHYKDEFCKRKQWEERGRTLDRLLLLYSTKYVGPLYASSGSCESSSESICRESRRERACATSVCVESSICKGFGGVADTWTESDDCVDGGRLCAERGGCKALSSGSVDSHTKSSSSSSSSWSIHWRLRFPRGRRIRLESETVSEEF